MGVSLDHPGEQVDVGAGGGGGSSSGILTWRYHSKPVPAGINRPIVTFSFSPRR